MPNYKIKHRIPARQDGWEHKIPNNFFQTYRTAEVDETSFSRHANLVSANPKVNFWFFDDLAMDRFMLENFQDRPIYSIYKGQSFGAAKADIWRYCVLWKYGGIYLDFDASLKAPIDSLPSDASEIIAYERNAILDFISEGYTPHRRAKRAVH